MSGYQTYTRFQRIEAQAAQLGFRIGNPKHGHWNDTSAGDMVAIYPKDDELPTFSRDAEIFCGSFSSLEVFLTGWARAQQYYMILRLSDDKKRKKYEDKERERQRLAKLKLEQKEMWNVLADKKEIPIPESF